MSASSWQSAWDEAQSRLAAIRDSISSSSSPDPALIRIGQLDAEQLDEQLVYILREPLDTAITFLNVRPLLPCTCSYELICRYFLGQHQITL
jgi:peroxin-2